MLPITTSPCDELFSHFNIFIRINIDDFERHFKSELQRTGWR